MTRRAFLAEAITLTAAPRAAEAQQAGQVSRIGWLGIDQELAFVFLLGVMVAAAISVAVWAFRVYKKVPDEAGAKWRANEVPRHLVGCMGFAFLPVPLIAIFWPIAFLLPGLAFLVSCLRYIVTMSEAHTT
ncbi:MAG: hypothetical protein ACRELS_20845, partial [Candidatus Rokuibacteriota bacterium]